MGEKEVKENKEQKKPKKETKHTPEPSRHALGATTSRKRSFRDLRAEFNAKCKAGNFQGAWEISKLYHRRWFEKHR